MQEKIRWALAALVASLLTGAACSTDRNQDSNVVGSVTTGGTASGGATTDGAAGVPGGSPSGDSAGTGGSGGTAGTTGGVAGAAASGDADVDACEFEFAECCSARDGEPCRDLPEAECEARPYCSPVLGVLVEGDPWAARDKSMSFVACQSQCPGIRSDAETCAYHPDDTASCYYIRNGAIPDGWIEIFECYDIPAGFCGT